MLTGTSRVCAYWYVCAALRSERAAQPLSPRGTGAKSASVANNALSRSQAQVLVHLLWGLLWAPRWDRSAGPRVRVGHGQPARRPSYCNVCLSVCLCVSEPAPCPLTIVSTLPAPDTSLPSLHLVNSPAGFCSRKPALPTSWDQPHFMPRACPFSAILLAVGMHLVRTLEIHL